jgi:ATP-binding cassette subfamily B protein
MSRVRGLRAVRRIVAMLRPHGHGEGGPLTTGALLGLVVVALHVVRPWPLKWMLDYLTGTHAGHPVVAWVGRAPGVGLAALSALFVAIALLGAAAEFSQVMLLNGLGNRVFFRFRAALFDHILRLPLAYHESREVGELLTRNVYDTARLRRGVNGMLVRVFQTIVLFAAIIAVLLWIEPALGTVFAIGGGLALVMMGRRGRRVARAAKRQRRKEGSLAALVAAELRAVRELQTYGEQASAVRHQFAERNRKSLRQEQKVRRLAAGLVLRIEILLAITTALAVWLGARAVASGAIGAGDLVLFFSYALALRAPFADFARQTGRLGRTYACADRLLRIADRPPGVVDRPDAVAAGPIRAEIVLDDVATKAPKRTRHGRKWTLDGISVAIPAGARVALVGPNGAGKSTLLRLVLRLADPDRGRVLIDGRDLREYATDTIRAQTSVVFQHGVLAGLTARQNIALGAPDAKIEAVRAAAAAAGADRLVERLPLGYDTPVRRGGDLFSAGERQRLAIARALLRDGRLWLLDEPTTGLDLMAAAELTEVLLSVTRGRTTLWISHDPSLVSRLDWVVSLDRGRLVFAGPTGEYAERVGAHGADRPAPISTGV